MAHLLRPQLARSPREGLLRRPLALAISALLLGSALTTNVAAQAFPATLNLGSLVAGDGYRLDGATAQHRAGYSVSGAGDVNGDGLDDLIVSVDLGGTNGPGGAYVVFGRSTPVAAPLVLSSLDGSTGFRLDGVTNNDRAGFSVSAAGDLNDDGFDDIVVGAFAADPNGSASGSAYLVFGRGTPFAATLALSSLDGSTGVRMDGPSEFQSAGFSVSAAGDVNHDGIDDLIIGAPGQQQNTASTAGHGYVVFGRTTAFAATLNLGSLSGSDGFRLDGAAISSYAGRSVAGAGDLNGDGIDDVVIGADRAEVGGVVAGSAYVVFGRSTAFPAVIGLSGLNGSTGFRLDGTGPSDRFGRGLDGIGDFNGDGLDDLIVGAYGASPNGNMSGRAYVVFGRSTAFPATLAIATLSGGDGFRMDGLAASNRLGSSVSHAGDFNSDGMADLIVGAFIASPNGFASGSSYVLFGRTGGFAATFALGSLNGSNGLRLDGAVLGDYAGRSVSLAGDVNGDGLDDLIIGADGADPAGVSSGSSYVVFGRDTDKLFRNGFE